MKEARNVRSSATSGLKEGGREAGEDGVLRPSPLEKAAMRLVVAAKNFYNKNKYKLFFSIFLMYFSHLVTTYDSNLVIRS